MARVSKKVVGITPEERKALRDLYYDSALFQAHPIVVTNVKNAIGVLLGVLGRPDLAAVWEDSETLAHEP